MPVGELLRRTTSRELSEMMAYDRLEPFGEGRTNLEIATLLAITANVNRDPKRIPEPFKPETFVPYHAPYEPPPREKKRAVARKLRSFLRTRKHK
jgi:hypothetical protein